MRILSLGGTAFIGRHTVERLLAQGHDVTLCHRGVTGSDLYPEAPRILTHRALLPQALPPGASWDVVLDFTAYFPIHVETATQALRGRAGRYVLVSSLSALEDAGVGQTEEGARLVPCTPEQAVSVANEEYGARKAGCERALAASGIPFAVARPGLTYGPHDHTERVRAYLREARAGRVRAPPGARLLPLAYVGDVADALVALATRPDLGGAFHLVDPTRPTLARFLDALARVAGPFEVEPADREEGPLPTVWAHDGQVDASRAVKELGLRGTPLEDALRETMRAMDA